MREDGGIAIVVARRFLVGGLFADFGNNWIVETGKENGLVVTRKLLDEVCCLLDSLEFKS